MLTRLNAAERARWRVIEMLEAGAVEVSTAHLLDPVDVRALADFEGVGWAEKREGRWTLTEEGQAVIAEVRSIVAD
jgi:hypothetical protein